MEIGLDGMGTGQGRAETDGETLCRVAAKGTQALTGRGQSMVPCPVPFFPLRR